MYRSIFFVNFTKVDDVPGSYDHYCPIARSLDVLGDRWTLLVLRDLSLSPQRFTDLRAGLPGIPPNVLSQRLKRLVEDGLVVVEELPPPAARSVYTLTDRGRDVIPVLRALVRFGTPDLAPATEDSSLRPRAVVPVVFLSWFDEAEARSLDVDEHYDVVVGDRPAKHLSSRHPTLHRRVDEPAAVTLEGPAWAHVRLRQGDTLADTPLTVTGPAAARARFRRLYALA